MILTDDIAIMDLPLQRRGVWTTGVLELHVGPVRDFGWFTGWFELESYS